MYNRIHINKKYFFLHSNGRSAYSGAKEDNMYLLVQHKSHITKVIVMAAVARPRNMEDGSYFNGKLDIWPFVNWMMA